MNSKMKKTYAKKKTYCSSGGIYFILYIQIKQTHCNHQNETPETAQNNSTGKINMNLSSLKKGREWSDLDGEQLLA